MHTMPRGGKTLTDLKLIGARDEYRGLYIVPIEEWSQFFRSDNWHTFHPILMEDPLGLQIDHRDLDKANNVWSNLRLATSLQNNVNKPSQRSGLKGAYPQPSGRFVSYIRYNGKLISLGTFDTEAEANAAYAAAAAKLYGEFGRAA